MKNSLTCLLKKASGAALGGVLALVTLPALATSAQAGTYIVDTKYFEVALITDYSEIWIDRKSKAKRSVRVLRPNVPSGFYSLGDVAIEINGSYDIGQDKYPPTIAIRPKKREYMQPQHGAREVWDSGGSPVARWARFYQPNCPRDYYALGGFVSSQDRSVWPDNIGCVHKDFVMSAVWKDNPVWNDSGSRAKRSTAIWNADYRGTTPNGTLIMPMNSMFPTDNHAKPNAPAKVLRLDVSDVNIFATGNTPFMGATTPTLNSPNDPMVPSYVDTKEYQVPFYLIKDPDFSPIQQWMESPTYTVKKTTKYEYSGNMHSNVSACDGTKGATNFSFASSTGVEHSSSWNVGASLGFSAEYELKAAPLGLGGTMTYGVSVEFSAGHEWGSASSYGEEVAISRDIPAGTAMAMFYLSSEYQVFRKGSNIPLTQETAKSRHPNVHFAEYTLPGWSPENNCPRSDFLLSGPFTLEKDHKYSSASGLHYLLLDDRGLAVYTDTDHEIWKLKFGNPGGNLSLDEVTLAKDGQITITLRDPSRWVMKETVYDPPAPSGRGFLGQMLRAEHARKYPQIIRKQVYEGPTQNINLVNDPNRPSGTLLHLTKEGTLQVVTRDGRTVWNSTDQGTVRTRERVPSAD